MPNRRSSVVSSEATAVLIEELPPIEKIEESTMEDYKKLNEKVDKVMSKIKTRKERKPRKKK